jgi:hypothetical protein
MPHCPSLLQQGCMPLAGLHRRDVMLPSIFMGFILTAAEGEQVLLLLHGKPSAASKVACDGIAIFASSTRFEDELSLTAF